MPMTLWSVEVSHLRMPVGPCSSWAPCPSCPSAGACGRWRPVASCDPPGGARTSATVISTSSCVAAVAAGAGVAGVTGVTRTARVTGARGAVDVGVHGRRELADGTGVGLLVGRSRLQPGLVGGRGHGTDVEEHQRVVEAAQLGALPAVDTAVDHVEVEGRPVAGAGVTAEVELGHVEAGEHGVGGPEV